MLRLVGDEYILLFMHYKQHLVNKCILLYMRFHNIKSTNAFYSAYIINNI